MYPPFWYKNNSQRIYRLHGCPKDDTIFSGVGIIFRYLLKPFGVGSIGRFLFCDIAISSNSTQKPYFVCRVSISAIDKLVAAAIVSIETPNERRF